MKTLIALAPMALLAGSPTHFEVQATFVPPSKAGADGAVAVLFTQKDPDVHVNEVPAPRLKLDPGQSLLVEKPAPRTPGDSEPSEFGVTRYLDLDRPVRFPVGVAPGAAAGKHVVKGKLTYFYCSKREGWCRKGTQPLEIPVQIR